MKKYNLEELKPIIEEVVNTSMSMAEAASKTNMNRKTFFKYAKLLNLFIPNQSGIGIKKKMPITPIKEILEGKHPQYQTYKLNKRLIKENYKKHECEICKNQIWNNLPIPLELDHIDGNPYNHKLQNIRLICPNCHAQTSNYRSKNKIKKQVF